MASNLVHEFTDANFEAEVLRSDRPVLVDFWAEWCMPCRMLTPTIDQLASEFQGKVKVGKVNTDTSRQVAVKYGITAIPTVMVFNKGELKRRMPGLQGKGEYLAALNAEIGTT